MSLTLSFSFWTGSTAVKVQVFFTWSWVTWSRDPHQSCLERKLLQIKKINRHRAPTGRPCRVHRGRAQGTQSGCWLQPDVWAPSAEAPDFEFFSIWFSWKTPWSSYKYLSLTAIAASASRRWCRREESSASSTSRSSSFISEDHKLSLKMF